MIAAGVHRYRAEGVPPAGRLHQERGPVDAFRAVVALMRRAETGLAEIVLAPAVDLVAELARAGVVVAGDDVDEVVRVRDAAGGRPMGPPI